MTFRDFSTGKQSGTELSNWFSFPRTVQLYQICLHLKVQRLLGVESPLSCLGESGTCPEVAVDTIFPKPEYSAYLACSTATLNISAGGLGLAVAGQDEEAWHQLQFDGSISILRQLSPASGKPVDTFRVRATYYVERRGLVGIYRTGFRQA